MGPLSSKYPRFDPETGQVQIICLGVNMSTTRISYGASYSFRGRIVLLLTLTMNASSHHPAASAGAFSLFQSNYPWVYFQIHFCF